jgi:hypothetical protein
MARIAVFMTIPDEEIASGWANDLSSLEESITVRLDEIYDDEAVPHTPKVLGIEVDSEQ